MNSATPDIREIAVATDTALATLYTELGSARSWLETQTRDYGRLYAEYRAPRYTPLAKDLVERLEADIASGGDAYGSKAAGVETLTKALAEIASISAEIEETEEPYRRLGGWSRFFLVNNTGGHIHSSMSCSTCRYDTSFSWLPELSGLTEAEAVDAYGPILCTVCFPSAPVEWTGGESKAVTAAREERDRAKAEREAKKDAKRLISGSDAGIVVTASGYSERIKTVAAAKKFLTDGYEGLYGSLPWDGKRYLPEDRDIVAAALLGRPGVKETSVEEILAAAAKRAAKRK